MLLRNRGCRASAGLTLGAMTTGRSTPNNSVRRPRATESAMPAANLLTVLIVAGATRTISAGGQGGGGVSEGRRNGCATTKGTAGPAQRLGRRRLGVRR